MGCSGGCNTPIRVNIEKPAPESVELALSDGFWAVTTSVIQSTLW